MFTYTPYHLWPISRMGVPKDFDQQFQRVYEAIGNVRGKS